MSETRQALSPPRRKIAFFLPDMAGGGAERVQLAIMRHLVAAGHEVHLILAFQGGVLLPLVPPEVRVIELRAARLAGSLPGLVRYLRREKPWSLQAIMWPCTVIAVAARMLARSATKLVLSEHVALSKQYSSPRQHRLLSATLRLFHSRAEKVVAVSRGAAADVEALSGLPTGMVEVIYNPMDLPAKLPSAAHLWPEWQGGRPRIVTLGRLSEQKNHALLLHAFYAVLKCHAEATLIILGEGPLRPQLEQQIHALGLKDRVMLPGFVVDPWPILLSADLFVLSSDYEGMSLVLVEAMHAGLRVVSTDCVAGPSELLDGGRFGRLASVGDADALARAMMEELECPGDPARQKARAREITSARNLERYAELLAG